MKYARMAESRLTKVTIPSLSGGLNIYDIPSRVADNQLTACDNLWWYRGVLRTRPGLTCGDWMPIERYTIRQIVDERTVLLSHFTEGDTVTFRAAELSENGELVRLGALQNGYTLKMSAQGDNSALGVRAGKNADTRWYYLLSNGDIIKEQLNGADGWASVEPYVPTVLINGVGEECVAAAEPTVYEDYNMLTRSFCCHYTTDGTSSTFKLPERNLATDLPGVTRESEAGGMLAHVEIDVYGTAGLRTIVVDLKVNDNGKVVNAASGASVPFSIDLDPTEAGVSGKYVSTKLQIAFDAVTGTLTMNVLGREDGPTTTLVTVGSLPFVNANNLRITAWRGREYEEKRLAICRMTRGTWYGGDRSGIAGGTRYFVCGNPDEPDLLCWSGIEHPLYFPEHNCVRVGDTHAAITSLGKQGNLLAVFKEHELYALQYLSSDSEDYSFALSGGVAVTSYMATFVMMPINASVGCDCPDTVRLVNNRLVWGNSDGCVYMLTAANQWSERNVRMISRNVRDAIVACGADALRHAYAAELEGYYLMLVGNKVFLMNTQTSAFASFSYYDDEDKASKAIQWYAWTLPEYMAYMGVVTVGNALRFVVTNIETQEGAVALLDAEEDTDNGMPIRSRFVTKRWDFGVVDYKKSVEHLYLGVRCTDMPHLLVTYLTEKGKHIDPYHMKNSVVDDADCCLSRHLTPNVRMVQTFGLEIDSRSAIEVDSLTIKIKTQGVVR